MPEENDVTSEEFAEEMHAEPKNLDGEPGVATTEEEVAAEAVEPSGAEETPQETAAEPASETFVEEMHAEPKNLDGEPGVATTEEEAAAEAVELSGAEEPQEAAGEPASEQFAEEMHAEPKNLDGEPGVASAEEEAAVEAIEPSGAEEASPEVTGESHGSGEQAEAAAEAVEPSAEPSESLSAEEILAPDAGREQPKWPAEDAELTAVLEAVIYITDEPLTLEQMSAALEQPRDRIKRLLEDLVAEWQKPHHGLSIREVAGGYKMATKAEHHEAVRQFVKSLKPPMKLSLPALETLAVIAYKQPVTAPEIMDIRGVQGAGVLKTLIERKLIAAAGRKNVIGKPILYKTTKEFLLQFGLKDLSELPSVKEFEELTRFAAEPEPAAPAEAQPAPAAEAVPEPVAE